MLFNSKISSFFPISRVHESVKIAQHDVCFLIIKLTEIKISWLYVSFSFGMKLFIGMFCNFAEFFGNLDDGDWSDMGIRGAMSELKICWGWGWNYHYKIPPKFPKYRSPYSKKNPIQLNDIIKVDLISFSKYSDNGFSSLKRHKNFVIKIMFNEKLNENACHCAH